MMLNQVARRYAKALFEVGKKSEKIELILSELREIEKVFQQNPEIKEFLFSPVVEPELKKKSLQSALGGKISQEAVNFLLLVIEKRRMDAFSEIFKSFQELCDGAHGVTRGVVRSSTSLSPEERKKIEATVKKATKKEVILSFEIDSKILGGLVADVAGYTFDDSLSTHLMRINDDLNRRMV